MNLEGPSLRLTCSLECRICERIIDTDTRSENLVAVALMGVSDDPYRVCPGCMTDLSYDDATVSDEKFRQRVRMYYYERGIVLRQTATGQWQKAKLHHDDPNATHHAS